MTSTRLPGKVMKRVLGRPLLSYVIERLQRVRDDVRVVVATTTNAGDDAIEILCRDMGVPIFRGSEHDVLDRTAKAAARYQADPVIRVTSDCPLIDPEVSRVVLERYELGGCDYVANTLTRSYPRGMDTEVLSARVLRISDVEATKPHEREHVTPFVYEHPDRFRLCNVENERDLSGYRLTVDTPEDFSLVTAIYERLSPTEPSFGMSDVIALLDRDEGLRGLNAAVEQKPLGGQ